MAPTVRHRIEQRTGVTTRVLAGYEDRGWLPPAELTEEAAYERSLRLVRLLREELTPRQVDEVFTLLGAERRTEMPRLMAIERFDQALQAALRISPSTSIDELKREILNRDPALYEELRAESSAQDFASRQAFLEAQRRCAIIGKGVHAIALAGAWEVLGYAGARDASQVHATPPPGTRTMEEIHRMVAEVKKRNPNLDDVAARKMVFTQRPDLYHAYRRESTRTKGGAR